MEVGEELRLSRAGFRPVRRRYVVTALLAAVAAMTAELWTIQLHAIWPEACFKPWRSSLAILLHAFLTALRLVCSSTRKLCSYYGTYRVCVGLVSLLLIGYLYCAISNVVATVSSRGLLTLIDNNLLGKYIVFDEFEPEHVLSKRVNSPVIVKGGLPNTMWRYLGESAHFRCNYSFLFPSGLELYDDDILWMHNGSVIWRDDPRYEIKYDVDDHGPKDYGLHLYSLSMELRVHFITEMHFGVYDCVKAEYIEHLTHPPSAKNYPRSLQVFDKWLRSEWYCFDTTDPVCGEVNPAKIRFRRIGKMHLRQIMPEKRVIVVPTGGVMISFGTCSLVSDLDPSLVSFEYRVNGKEFHDYFKDYEGMQLLCSLLIVFYALYKYVSILDIPYFHIRHYHESYSLVYALAFPSVAFGEHKIIFNMDLTNYTTGVTEVTEVEYPVTFIFKPAPPLLMEVYFLLTNTSDVTVNDFTDTFISETMTFWIRIEAALVFFVPPVLMILAMWLVKQSVMHVLVPLWHAIFFIGFQRPSEGTLADICVSEPHEPDLRYDVFVSYASEDPEDRYFVLHVLLPKLQRLGLSVCLPEQERAPNETELRGTSHLVQACSFYIVVVTPSYIESAICNRLELPFILSRFQYREVNDHQVVLVKLRACIIPGGLHCSLPVINLTNQEVEGQLDDIISGWTPKNRLGRNSLLSLF